MNPALTALALALALAASAYFFKATQLQKAQILIEKQRATIAELSAKPRTVKEVEYITIYKDRKSAALDKIPAPTKESDCESRLSAYDGLIFSF